MLNDLVKQYETFWVTNAPMEQIADFCRQHLDLVTTDSNNKKSPELLQILCKSSKWGDRLLQPRFLNALQENDDKLLTAILYYFNNYFMIDKYDDINGISYHRIKYAQIILSRKDSIPEKIRACFWAAVAKGIWEHTGVLFSEASALQYNDYAPDVCNDMNVIDNEAIRKLTISSKRANYQPYQTHPPLPFLYTTGFISNRLTNAIAKDSISNFDNQWLKTVHGVTQEILEEALKAMIQYKAFKLIVYFLENRWERIQKFCDPVNLLIYLCSQHTYSSKILPIIHLLEKKNPGTCCAADSHPTYGTPLWHCLHFFPSVYVKQSDVLAQTLIEYGCNPNACNHIGLSYNSCKKAIELVQSIPFNY